MFNIAFDWNQSTGMIVSTILILMFSILGSLPATIITDAMQSILILTGLVVLAATVVVHVDGFGTLIENT